MQTSFMDYIPYSSQSETTQNMVIICSNCNQHCQPILWTEYCIVPNLKHNTNMVIACSNCNQHWKPVLWTVYCTALNLKHNTNMVITCSNCNQYQTPASWVYSAALSLKPNTKHATIVTKSGHKLHGNPAQP